MSLTNPWVLQTTPSTTLNSVAYGAGRYVAVGSSGNVITSLDGINWTTVASGNTQNWRIVRYANGIFCACNQNNSTIGFMTSPDGLVWTTRSIPVSREVYNVAFGNGVWCACLIRTGSNINILRSTNNAVSWTEISTPQPTTGFVNWTGLTYGNGTWVVSSNRAINNNIMTSTDDGLTWTVQTKSTADASWVVEFGNGKFILSTATTARYFISTDGISWTAYLFPLNLGWRSLTYANGIWVAVGTTSSTNSSVYSTDDGLSFTSKTTPSGAYISVNSGNGKFVAVVIGTTTNAIMTWDYLTLETAAFLLNII